MCVHFENVASAAGLADATLCRFGSFADARKAQTAYTCIQYIYDTYDCIYVYIYVHVYIYIYIYIAKLAPGVCVVRAANGSTTSRRGATGFASHPPHL